MILFRIDVHYEKRKKKMNINNVTLGGFLVKDIEVKHTTSGISIGTGAIAITKKIKDKEPETSFFDFVCFGRWAEISAQNGKKGDKVIIAGELKQERWEKDGQKRSKVVVIANQIYTYKWEKQGAPTATTTPTPKPIDDEIPF